MKTMAYQRREAAIRHQRIRDFIYRIVEIRFQPIFPQIRLAGLSDDALDEIEAWRKAALLPIARFVGWWDWREEWRKISRRECRVELTIWDGATLCGAAIGRVSRRRVTATIHFIQANPNSHPLEGAIGRIASTYLEELAKELRCEEIAIDHPVTPLIDYYQNLGFSNAVVRGGRTVRLVRKLSY